MIGIFGGTFDPVHYGHLRMAIEVKQALKLASVSLIPCNIPAHRIPPIATAQQRLQMLQLAVINHPDLAIDARELQRAGPSYMIDTLQSIKQEQPDASLCLVIGQDAYAGFDSWHRWQEIFSLAHLVVMTRPHEDAACSPALTEFAESRIVTTVDDLYKAGFGRILFVSVTPLAISATAIRQMLKNRASVEFLLPDVVCQYIKEHNIY